MVFDTKKRRDASRPMSRSVLAILIERVAELTCGKAWQQVQGALDELQITEFFNLNLRVLMRNELPTSTTNTLKL